MRALAILAAPALAAALHKKYLPPFAASVAQDCSNLPGPWTGGFSTICGESPIGDSYMFNWTDPTKPFGAWTATDDSGNGWSKGLAQNSPDNSTVVIVLDGSQKLNGNITSTKSGGQCSCIQWDNGSWWMKQGPPPPPITDVHIIAMNHLDGAFLVLMSQILAHARATCMELSPPLTLSHAFSARAQSDTMASPVLASSTTFSTDISRCTSRGRSLWRSS